MNACQRLVMRRTNRGVMAKGTDSYTQRADLCGRPVADGHHACTRHEADDAKVAAQLAARRQAARS